MTLPKTSISGPNVDRGCTIAAGKQTSGDKFIVKQFYYVTAEKYYYPKMSLHKRQPCSMYTWRMNSSIAKATLTNLLSCNTDGISQGRTETLVFFFYVRAAAHKAACHTTARQPQSFFLPTCKERILCAFHIWRILWTRKLSLSPFQALCRHEPFLKNFKAQLLSDSQCPRQPWQSVSTLPPRNNRTHKHRLFPADSQLLTSPCAELRVNLRQGSPGLLTTPKSRPSLETSYTAQQAAIQVRLKVGIPSCDFTRAHAWIWYRPVILSVRQTREICLLGYTLVKQSSAGCNNEWLSAVQPLHTNARGSWSPTAAGRQHVKAAFRHETPQMPSGEPAKAPTAASQTNTSLLQCEISQGRCVTWSAAM